ncbi:hypothetical protein HDA40_007247 [Hamadaea flava]|uniref:Uncharacterized protein n=1 Tax=Hamadaea flava TaxID=1742688 RepID=A0ABV8LT92_9ACTN|nr:hypothetical protein [Hamadaea flava]MCP2328740.1 hypothetical protein [Hamadaea flava]
MAPGSPATEAVYGTVAGGLGEVPGVTWITAPEESDVDGHCTVLALDLDGELDLYRGAGRG